jgi:hypothetical protein
VNQTEPQGTAKNFSQAGAPFSGGKTGAMAGKLSKPAGEWNIAAKGPQAI